MLPFFIAIAAVCVVPASYFYWRILAFVGRNRTAAKFAFAFALSTGLVSLNAAAYSFYRRAEADASQPFTDLVFEDELEASVAFYYGLIATSMALLFPKTNPHRTRFVAKCRACGNKKALHSPLCIRCGTRLLPEAALGES